MALSVRELPAAAYRRAVSLSFSLAPSAFTRKGFFKLT